MGQNSIVHRVCHLRKKSAEKNQDCSKFTSSVRGGTVRMAAFFSRLNSVFSSYTLPSHHHRNANNTVYPDQPVEFNHA
jgi:hypothetical protein